MIKNIRQTSTSFLKSIFVVLCLFFSSLLSAQTWHTIIDSCTGWYDDVTMFQNNSNEYFGAGRDLTVKLSKNGELIFLDNDFESQILKSGLRCLMIFYTRFHP